MFGRPSRTEQLFHEIMRRLSTTDQQFEETRQFTRDMMRRMEKVTDDHTRAMDEVVRRLEDLTAESRAQRQALLRVIDRMDRLDPGGSAA